MKAMRSFAVLLIFVPTNQSKRNKPSAFLKANDNSDWHGDVDSFPSNLHANTHLKVYFLYNIRFIGVISINAKTGYFVIHAFLKVF